MSEMSEMQNKKNAHLLVPHIKIFFGTYRRYSRFQHFQFGKHTSSTPKCCLKGFVRTVVCTVWYVRYTSGQKPLR